MHIIFFSTGKKKNRVGYLTYVPIFLRTSPGESEVILEHSQQVILMYFGPVFTAACTPQYLMDSLCSLARSSPSQWGHLGMDSPWCCPVWKWGQREVRQGAEAKVSLWGIFSTVDQCRRMEKVRDSSQMVTEAKRGRSRGSRNCSEGAGVWKLIKIIPWWQKPKVSEAHMNGKPPWDLRISLEFIF